MQVWNFNLTDPEGDGIWKGKIQIMPGETGKAQLKVTAIDGENIDYLSIGINFVKEDTDNTSLFVTAGAVGSLILISLLVAFIVIRRRKRLADLDLIDSWGVFGGESKEYLEEELDI